MGILSDILLHMFVQRFPRASSLFQIQRAFLGTQALLAGQSVLAANQFNREKIEHVISAAQRMKNIVETDGYSKELEGKVLLNVFMEPSTRTSSSFQTAMLRLGGSVVPISEATSSAQKGETLEDTIKVINAYADVIVLRHPEVGSAQRAANVANVPVLNAGDGFGEHPTQALLDCTCMAGELGGLDGLTISFVGDLKFGRTVHSLAQMLSHFNVKINFISSDNLKAPAKLTEKLAQSNVKVSEYSLSQFNEVLPQTDVLYCTRIQKERFASVEEYMKEKGLYVISTEMLDKNKAKKGMIVMHPLPRVDEIVPEFDNDPRARYFQQVQYGVYTRMALLSEVLRKA